MALLDDIGTALTDAGVVSSGWSLFKSFSPDAPDQCITVYETGGVAPAQTPGLGAQWPSFQVRVRGKRLEYDVARTKLQAVHDALNNATVSGYVYVYVAHSGVIPLGHDEKQRPLIVLNFDTMKAGA